MNQKQYRYPIQTRLTAKEKILIIKAAEHSALSLSSFLRIYSIEKARQILKDNEIEVTSE